jgi:uncharacterized protein (DUF433 family)
MNWEKYIHSDPQIFLGEPTIKGTRLSVEFLLSLFAAGWSQQQILERKLSYTHTGSIKGSFRFYG